MSDRTAALNNVSIEDVVWPNACIRCGNPVEDPYCAIRVDLRQSWASILRSDKDHIYLPACSRCRRKNILGHTLERLGCTLGVIALIGSLLLDDAFDIRGPQFAGLGALMFAGYLLITIGGYFRVSVVIKQRSAGTWLFKFRSLEMCRRFIDCNETGNGVHAMFTDPEENRPVNLARDLYVEAGLLEHRGQWEEAMALYLKISQLDGHELKSAALESISELEDKMACAQEEHS